MGLAMGRFITARKHGTEKCPGCTEEASVNEWDTRTDMFFIGTSWKTRFQLLGWCPLEPGDGGTSSELRDDVFFMSTWAIPSAVSLEVGNAFIYPGKVSAIQEITEFLWVGMWVTLNCQYLPGWCPQLLQWLVVYLEGLWGSGLGTSLEGRVNLCRDL